MLFLLAWCIILLFYSLSRFVLQLISLALGLRGEQEGRHGCTTVPTRGARRNFSEGKGKRLIHNLQGQIQPRKCIQHFAKEVKRLEPKV